MPLGRLAGGLEYLRVLLGVIAAQYYKRDVYRRQYIFHGLRGLFSRPVLPVRVRADKPEGYHLRAQVVLAVLRPFHGVGADILINIL